MSLAFGLLPSFAGGIMRPAGRPAAAAKQGREHTRGEQQTDGSKTHFVSDFKLRGIGLLIPIAVVVCDVM